MVLRMDSRHWYAVEADADGVRVIAQVGPFQQTVATGAGYRHEMSLTIAAEPPANAGALGVSLGPDDILLGFASGDAFTALARLDGRYLCPEVAASFTGRTIGIGALHSSARLLRFSYRPSTEETS